MLERSIELACRLHVKRMLALTMPIHIEIWLERTGSGDIVERLADKYSLNIVASRTDISLTSVWHFIRRISGDRPVRILYICDWDQKKDRVEAGEKIRSVLKQYGLKVDLEIIKVALTEEECVKYDLVPMPECRGEKVTELHALEAVMPGLLCSKLERVINSFTDYKIVKDAEERACRVIDRLSANLNGVIERDSDFYEAFAKIQSVYSRN